MAKTSGGVRGGNTARETEQKGPSYEEKYNALLDDIAKGRAFLSDIWDDMNQDQRELALMEAGFSGLIGEDLDMGNLYYAGDKDALLSRLEEDIVNENDPAYGMDDSTSWTIRYTDGRTRSLSRGMDNDFEIKMSAAGSYSANYRKARSAIQVSKVAWILKSDGYDQPEYYVRNDAAMADLKKYGGFERWKNGRGEKRRNYIQDDWV